jgi:hypothetical protein
MMKFAVCYFFYFFVILCYCCNLYGQIHNSSVRIVYRLSSLLLPTSTKPLLDFTDVKSNNQSSFRLQKLFAASLPYRPTQAVNWFIAERSAIKRLEQRLFITEKGARFFSAGTSTAHGLVTCPVACVYYLESLLYNAHKALRPTNTYARGFCYDSAMYTGPVTGFRRARFMSSPKCARTRRRGEGVGD